MKSEPLIFPDGVRFARADEIPGRAASREETIARLEKPDIRTGFTVMKTEDDAFNTYVEANVHAPDIWRLFSELVRQLMPKKGCPIITHERNEPWIGPQVPTALILETVGEFARAIANDGYLEFGIIEQTDDKIEEIFISETKYFNVWTSQPEVLHGIMADFAIPEALELQFIDQYPRVTEALERPPFEIAEQLQRRLEALASES